MSEVNNEHSGIENVGEALSKAELFIEKIKSRIIIAVAAIVLVIGGYFVFKKAYVAPMEKEAQEQMFVAEKYFEKDSFQLALNGDGNNWGFLKITEEYGITKAADLAHYYAGICYLQTGNFKAAIEHLEEYDGDDKLIAPIAVGATGDAYVELGDLKKGAKLYEKAADMSENDFTSPLYLMKAGVIYENLKDFKKALAIYKQIKKDFPRSTEGRTIDKYITRAELLSK